MHLLSINKFTYKGETSHYFLRNRCRNLLMFLNQLITCICKGGGSADNLFWRQMLFYFGRARFAKNCLALLNSSRIHPKHFPDVAIRILKASAVHKAKIIRFP